MNHLKLQAQRGFTLLELMVVVAIIGILAAIAIPNFQEVSMRAKRSELATNVEGIRASQMAYFHQYDAFVNCGPAPVEPAELGPVDFPGDPGFDLIGWRADGKVYGSYAATTQVEENLQGGGTIPGFAVEGRSDIDQDDVNVSVTASRQIKPTLSNDLEY